MIIWIDSRVVWPVVLFERDGYGVVVDSLRELEGAYEEGMWDEVAESFDAAQYRLIPELVGGTVRFRRHPSPDPETFKRTLAESLGRAFRETRLRRIPANAEQREMLARASATELLAMLVARQHVR